MPRLLSLTGPWVDENCICMELSSERPLIIVETGLRCVLSLCILSIIHQCATGELYVFPYLGSDEN